MPSRPTIPTSSARWPSTTVNRETSESLGKQAIGLPFDYRVALAHALFQLRPVEYLDLTAIVLNQSRRLQLSGGLRDALAAHSQHVRDQLLGHGELVRGQPVQAQEQPAAQLLLHRVMPVAYGRLRHLRDQRLGVAQQQMLQRAVALELPLEDFRR